MILKDAPSCTGWHCVRGHLPQWLEQWKPKMKNSSSDPSLYLWVYQIWASGHSLHQMGLLRSRLAKELTGKMPWWLLKSFPHLRRKLSTLNTKTEPFNLRKGISILLMENRRGKERADTLKIDGHWQESSEIERCNGRTGDGKQLNYLWALLLQTSRSQYWCNPGNSTEPYTSTKVPTI